MACGCDNGVHAVDLGSDHTSIGIGRRQVARGCSVSRHSCSRSGYLGEGTVGTTPADAGKRCTVTEKSSETDRRDSVETPTTGRLSLEPARVVARHSRAGRFRLHLDNRNGSVSQRVRLRGCDPERKVRFAFRPRTLDVPPGHVGSARVRVRASRPSSDVTGTHTVTVTADDGSETTEATATFVQSTGQSRRVQRTLLTLLGAAAVAVGAVRPWLDNGGPGLLLTAPRIIASLEVVIATAGAGAVSDVVGLVVDLQPLLRFATLMAGLSMAFGLTDAGGVRTREAALRVAVLGGATAVFSLLFGFHLADGMLLVLLGSFVGFISGTCMQR